MRIIAGSLRSRTLEAPPGLATRPTSDRLRETLFNVLAARIQGAAFLDLYAGSGAVGIEALSRGAASVAFVERAPAALKVLRANLDHLGLAAPGTTAGFRVHASAVGTFLRRPAGATPTPERYEAVRERYEVLFLDPPWDAAEEYAATLSLLGGSAAGVLGADSLVIAEHRKKQRLEDRYGSLQRTRLLEQGDAALSFYSAARRLPWQEETSPQKPIGGLWHYERNERLQ
jgi:16S rRNA (guanine(966)-N(2))-methyltransferase RsmD